jgi:hypothetical protein
VGDWVIKFYRVGLNTSSNCNAGECLYFELGFLRVVFDSMVEIPNGEQFKPGGSIWLDTMNKFKRCGEFTPQTTGYLVEHECRMFNSKIPEFTTDLFFSDISSCHPDDRPPCRFDKTI